MEVLGSSEISEPRYPVHILPQSQSLKAQKAEIFYVLLLVVWFYIQFENLVQLRNQPA